MKKNMIATALKITNKVNGRYYMVSEGVAREIDRNDEVKEDGEVLYLENFEEKDLLCFRALTFKKPDTVPTGYSVVDGILTKDGNQVTEQGELVLDKVIGNIIGQVICLTKAEDGVASLVKYLPDRNIFQSVTNDVPADLKVLVATDNRLLLGARLLETIPNVTDALKEVYQDLSYGTFILEITTEFPEVCRMVRPVYADLNGIKDVKGTTALHAFPAKTVKDIVDEETGEITGFAADKDVTLLFQGSQSVVLDFVADVAAFSRYLGTIVYKAGNVIRTGYDELISSPKVAELNGFDYLIDGSEEKDGEVLTYSFANEEYSVKTVLIKAVDGPVGRIVTVQ